MSAQHYLLPQRRCRVCGLADLDEGQDSEVFSSMMYHTLDSMSSDARFNFDDVFDANLPTAPPRGNAEKNVNQALQRTAVKNESTNVFVDTSTSTSWEAEYAENMLTCIRPSHPIFSVKYNRYITVAEMFKPADSLPSHKSTQPHPIVWGGVGWGGVGWGGMITSLTTPHDLDATLYDLHGQFHMILMLRSMIFIGNST